MERAGERRRGHVARRQCRQRHGGLGQRQRQHGAAHWDGGRTGQVLSVTVERLYFRDVDAIDARTACLLNSVNGVFSILLTEDGGKTWTPVPAAALPPALPGEGAFAASGTNVAVLGTGDAWFVTGAASRSRVLRTRDRGRTWTIADTPLLAGKSAGAFSVTFRDPITA